jgi:hypothetical protein
MNETSLVQKVKAEIERDITELEHAADSIRVKIHLASMDAQSTWNDLENQLRRLGERVQREGNHVADATVTLARQLKRSVKAFEAELQKPSQ